MRRGMVVSILLVLLLATSAGAQVVTRNWQSIVVEDFDSGEGWYARGGKFLATADQYPDTRFPFDFRFVEGVWPEQMGRPESDPPSVFGVQGSFTRKGYNYIEIFPIEDETGPDGEVVPRTIPLPGRPIAIDLWAWGSNFRYYLEVQVRDHRGIVHAIPMGHLNFGGWQNLHVDIPNHIPRAVRYVPQRRALELVKLVLWTTPEEAVDGFYFYVDQIKVLSDMFETRFDGEGLADPEFVQQVWGVDPRR